MLPSPSGAPSALPNTFVTSDKIKKYLEENLRQFARKDFSADDFYYSIVINIHNEKDLKIVEREYCEKYGINFDDPAVQSILRQFESFERERMMAPPPPVFRKRGSVSALSLSSAVVPERSSEKRVKAGRVLFPPVQEASTQTVVNGLSVEEALKILAERSNPRSCAQEQRLHYRRL